MQLQNQKMELFMMVTKIPIKLFFLHSKINRSRICFELPVGTLYFDGQRQRMKRTRRKPVLKRHSLPEDGC